MEKIKGDFHLRGKKPLTRQKLFAGSTLAISFTIGLYFFAKFVWSPLKNDSRYRQAQSEVDLLLVKEKALQNKPEIE